MAKIAKELKSWFEHGQDRKADRTLQQQLKGLDELQGRVVGRTVLDIGCAEGLISIHLIDSGAVAAHGIEMRPDYVEDAMRLREDRACTFEVANANEWEPCRQYDVVLMLAVLHKLIDPGAACRRFAKAARELVVLRLPPEHAPVIVDARSDYKRANMDKVLKSEGFTCFKKGRIGPRGEWMGYYERA